jgi:drug/metabolite transporter (DMT)-like permease
VSTSFAVVAASLGSTGFFALATALKHRSAGQTPDAQKFHPRQLTRFIAATATHPLWLGGILADAGGLGLQVYALHIGALAVVQPLMITALLFSLVLNHWVAGTRISGREVAGGAVLVASLAGFLYISGATSSAVTGQVHDAERGPAIAAGLLAVTLALSCVLIARKLPHGRGAAVLGVAVGIIYASTAALIKNCTNIVVDHGPLALLTSWQLYVLVAAGATGLVLSQLAFQAGPLTASLPAIATVDPLLSIALGVVVYEENLRHAPPSMLGAAGCLIVMSAAAFFLSRLEAAEASPPDAEETTALSRAPSV